MFSITTTVSSNAKGATTIVAKGHGRQRTIKSDPAKSPMQNAANACGTLLDTMLTPEQRAKMQHPSSASRVRTEPLTDGGGKHRWTINV